MCLDELTEFKVTKDYGWGVFREKDGHLLQLYGCHLRVPVLEGKWQVDPNDYALLTDYDGRMHF